MRFLAFADLHAASWAMKELKRKIKEHKPDYLINLGDFSIFDEGTEQVLKSLDKLGVPILTIHGNHETDTIVEYFCEQSKNLRYIHAKVEAVDGITFVAWGGGGFYYATDEEIGFEEWVKGLDMKQIKGPVVFLTHAPAFNTKLDVIRKSHVGCGSYRRFIEKHTKKIVLALSGHIHEGFYLADKVKDTVVMNPGPTGTIIDIDEKGKVSYKFDKLRDVPDMY